MRKFVLVAVTALTIALSASCGMTEDNKDNETKLTTATQQENAAGEAANISKNFKVLPDNAKKALDLASDGSQKVYPSANGSRSFGYTGKSKVNGADCYCFSVFDVDKEQTTPAADVAVSTDFTKVFASDAGKAQYKEVSLTASPSTSWCDIQTPAFKK